MSHISVRFISREICNQNAAGSKCYDRRINVQTIFSPPPNFRNPNYVWVSSFTRSSDKTPEILIEVSKLDQSMSLKEELAEMVEESSASLFAVAGSDDLEDAPEGHRPSDILPEARSVILIGQKMLDAQLDLQNMGGSYYTVSSRENMIKGHITFVSHELDRIGYRLSRYLEEKGYRVYHQLASEGGVDSRELVGLFSLKHAAEKAGMGVIGKNSLILSPEFGPRIRLTGLITDVELPPDEPLDVDFCRNCKDLCIEACPAGALEDPPDDSPYQIDKFKCCNSLATRANCRGCLNVCPVGSKRT